MSTLGPYILNVTTAAKLCSQSICNNHGRCIRRRMASDTYLHLNPNSFQIQMYIDGDQPHISVKGDLSRQQRDKMREEFICNCYQGWSGENCHSRGRGLRLRTHDKCMTVVFLSALLVWLLWALWTCCSMWMLWSQWCNVSGATLHAVEQKEELFEHFVWWQKSCEVILWLPPASQNVVLLWCFTGKASMRIFPTTFISYAGFYYSNNAQGIIF